MNPYQRNTEAAGSIDNFPPQGKGTPQSTDVRLSPRTIKMIEQYNTLNSGFHQHHTPLSGSKVILVGDPQVGKTSLFVRISKNLFEAVYRPTIGLDFQVKKYSVFGIPFNLTIWYLFLINIFLLIDWSLLLSLSLWRECSDSLYRLIDWLVNLGNEQQGHCWTREIQDADQDLPQRGQRMVGYLSLLADLAMTR